MTLPIPHNIQYPLHYDPVNYPVFDQSSSGTVSSINTITNCSAPVYVGDLVKITDPASPNFASGYVTVQTVSPPNSFTFSPNLVIDLTQRSLDIIHPTGEASLMTVLNRTVFTDFGPIVKRSSSVLSGSDLTIKSATVVNIPSASFDQTYIGKTITISGTPNNRNDGTFNISRVSNLETLILEGSYFDTTNVTATVALLIGLVNELKLRFNSHLVAVGVHGTNDTTNNILTSDATDLPSAITLLNDLATKFGSHILMVTGVPPVHKNSDSLDNLYSPAVVYNPSFPNIALTGAIVLVNEIRKNFEAHRQNLDFHLISDTSDRITNLRLKAVIGSGPLVGPFTWSINDPELGEIANSPSDVTVEVNSVPTVPDAVFGLLDAIVLPAPLNPGDSISLSYSYVKNPAVKTSTTNSFEYVLNQTGRTGESGICSMSSWTPNRVGVSTGLIKSSLSPNNIYDFIVEVVSAGVGQLISSGTVSVRISLDGITFGPPTSVPIDGIFSLAPSSPYLPVYVNTGVSLFFSLGSTTFDFGDQFVASSIGNVCPYRTYNIDPTDLVTDIKSPYEPFTSGWKYKGFERAYSAVSNDPTTLVSNVPTNKITYDVLNEEVKETTLRYDPTTLPQNATDPWNLEGRGIFTLSPGGSELKISDISALSGPESLPSFFSHTVDLRFLSSVSSAFRTRIDPTSVTSDGVFTGVSFGISDGKNSVIVGFIQTDATNLSSAISLANQIVTKFDAHLVLIGTHLPNDTFDTINVVNAVDLQSLIILVNREKVLFNTHIAYGSGNIHITADSINTIVVPDATDLNSSLILVNAIQTAFDAHRIASGVHYVSDTVNATTLIKQVGILTTGYPDIETSWISYAIDWSQYVTYRLVRNSNGSADLYLSGLPTPITSVDALNLPLTADVDARLDPMQQIFFGSIGKQSVSDSYWAFIRVDIIPLDSKQVSGNKSVSYLPNYTPEMDPITPWINIGQSGYTRAVFPLLTSDSTASADPSVVEDLGVTTGAYKGYLRIEPILSDKTLSSVEFQTQISYWTFGIDNRAAGVFIDDGNLSVHLVFLQASPTPATVTGINSEPFSIVNGDILTFSIDNGPVIPYTFIAPTLTLASVITDINTAVGFSFASASVIYPHNLQLTSPTIGAVSRITLIGGSALTKLGFTNGTYFGKDSNPEPRISWFGENYPDQDVLTWSPIGTQSVELLNRTLRISDSSIDDFKSYSFVDSLHTNQVFQTGFDWKFDARLKVISYIPGDPVVTGSNLKFCGILMNVDEGVNGKTVELQLALNLVNVPYINVLSYNPFTGNLDSIIELPFNWTDMDVHTYNIYTSKNSNLVLILVDNVLLGTFAYSSLNQGIGNPSINFGSGSQTNNPQTNFDLTTALSVVDWNSVCAFKDSKIADPTAASNRYVGLYTGGDPTILNSYYTYQIDWSLLHTYRIVRDPSNMVSIFIDNGAVPAISVNYDVLKLPASESSFFREITPDDQCIAFGSFSPFEISRSVWRFINYSIGKMTLTDLIVPPHNVLNQVNTISSSEHLNTTINHSHFATTIWSGGTPSDEFLYSPSVPAITVLGEGTPPIPMTQDLDSRGGPVYTQVPSISLPSDTYADEEALPAEQFVVQVSIPDGVLYEAMKFFNFDDGETGHVSPFIDEATGTLNDTTIGTVTHITINSRTQARRFPQYISATPPPTGVLVPW